MRHPLYDDDEQVTCMCTKCGWLGTASAPMFPCGGCKKYLARPIDMDVRKLKASEARCADLQARCERLEEALQDIVSASDQMWMPVRCFRSETQAGDDELKHEGAEVCADIARAALDTEKAAPAGEG